VSDASYILEAFKQGDLETLLMVLDEPPAHLSVPYSDAFGHCLEYAIYHSPLSLIQQLLEPGADPNYPVHAGFPALIAALTTTRSDRNQILELLIASGADIQQKGINGFTPLHLAASTNDISATEVQFLGQRSDNGSGDAVGAAEAAGHYVPDDVVDDLPF